MYYVETFEQNIKSQSYQEHTLLEGRYQLIRKIAVGGMGNVYKAVDTKNNNFPLAVKILHQQFRQHKQYIERFKREVDYCRQVSHPNVVKIFDLYCNDQIAFFTMEYIEGVSLEEKLLTEKIPLQEISKLLIEVCDGLRAIHNEGIVHRDLKPGNIMIQPDGSAKIIDFGISRDSSSRLTQKNVKVGSVSYMAPELWEGKKAVPQTDFYGVGCLLHEICTGKPPFLSEKPLELFMQHHKDKPKDLPEKYPQWLNELHHWLLAKKINQRPQNGGAIIDRIKAHCDDSLVVQTFTDHMSTQTVRGGQAMISVFPDLISGDRTENNKEKGKLNRKTLLLSLEATRSSKQEEEIRQGTQIRRSRTIMINLPLNSALVFEFEYPTLDFLFLGIFLASLNLFDGYLTSKGMETFGIHTEGNTLLKSLMYRYGHNQTLLVVKGIAIFLVFILTVAARKSKIVKNLVGTLSLIYLFAAVVPWIYILYYK